jgi:hypothetical protein
MQQMLMTTGKIRRGKEEKQTGKDITENTISIIRNNTVERAEKTPKKKDKEPERVGRGVEVFLLLFFCSFR